MAFDTATWAWPQWTIVILLLLTLLVSASMHGKPRIKWSGPEKGQPEEFNGFVAFILFGLWIFILSAGGFFS